MGLALNIIQFEGPYGRFATGQSVFDLIGNTPLIQLKRIGKILKAKIFAKLELLNPTGSVKDRIAKFMIESAGRKGILKKNSVIAGATTGNTGISFDMMVKLHKRRSCVRKCISPLVQKYLSEILTQIAMPHYITLVKWTEQGIRSVKDSPKRAEAFRREAQKGGGNFQIFFTLGQYDIVGVGEMPSDEAYLKLALWLGSLGNVRTKTLKAWPEADAAKVIAQLS